VEQQQQLAALVPMEFNQYADYGSFTVELAAHQAVVLVGVEAWEVMEPTDAVVEAAVAPLPYHQEVVEKVVTV
jgi:ribose 1,5-bisphosphokinase PhnN